MIFRSFKKAKILNNPETYEIEIEYIGFDKDKKTGIPTIDKLYESYKEENEYYPVLKKADIYDPLRLGIDTSLFENEESTFDEDTEYSMYSPRFDVLFMNYT